MSDNYYIGVYWGRRQESAAECAARLAVLLRLLPKHDPVFASWFRQGRSLKEALEHPLALDEQALQERLRTTEYPDVGYSFSAWNGRPADGEAARMSARCGSFSLSPHIPNNSLLYIPQQGPVAARLLRPDALAGILESMATAWEPDWGGAFSVQYRDYRDRTVPEHREDVHVGWMTYLSARRGAVPPVPAPSRTVPLLGLGTLVVTIDERFTIANPDHIEAADRLTHLLGEHGLLTPDY